MSSLILKTIALITMIIDHYGAIFEPFNMDYRIIGRIAFPIYTFLLVEGYIHTRDIKKYITRLITFALISEIPFDYAFYGGVNWSHQNIFFTLSIGLLAMHFMDKENGFSSTKNISIVLGAATLATLLNTDYSFMGIVYIMDFYFTREISTIKRLGIVGIIMFVINLVGSVGIQQYSLLALVVIALYNHKVGWKNKIVQIIYYAAYPLHLILFYLLNGR